MELSNRDIGNIIDALQFAIEERRTWLAANFSRNCILDKGALLDKKRKQIFDECLAQIKWYADLRRRLLKWEAS